VTPGWGCSCPPPPRDCSCAAPRAASGPPLFRALHCVGCKAKDRERTPGLKSPLWLPRRRVGCRGRWGRLHQPTRALKKMLRWYAIPASDAESPSHPHRQHLQARIPQDVLKIAAERFKGIQRQERTGFDPLATSRTSGATCHAFWRPELPYTSTAAPTSLSLFFGHDRGSVWQAPTVSTSEP
jgi:hypothetical protein